MNLLYPLNIKNDFIFNPSPRDFIVKEIPLYEFSGEGEHLILYIRKKNMTTTEMINKISSYLGILKKEIGYAGLKDKNAMTTQYISIPTKYENQILSFNYENIKILNITKHNNKIKIGHLQGNHFKIRLKKVLGIEKDKLDSTIKWIKKNGLPNYFGYQRFGTDGNNWEEGRDILEKKIKIRNKRMEKFLINSYQSYLFNLWLSKRVELSSLLQNFSETEVENLMNLTKNSLHNIKNQSHFFKILNGDLLMHYPYGKVFECENIEEEEIRFNNENISITGLLAGKKVSRAVKVAGEIESLFDKKTDEDGARRYAWIRIKDISTKYILEKAQYELSFSLPKGSYATNLLNMLKGIS